MPLITTLIGSYPPVRLPLPPLSEGEIIASIRNAVHQQQEAVKDKPIDWLFVSGQPQSDVVGIFAHGLGLSGEGLPYNVNQEIKHLKPITLHELVIAADTVPGKPLKAHITGPTLMAESSHLTNQSPSHYRDNTAIPRQLTLDIAHALAEEAKALTKPSGIPVAYLQIDEPTLVYGANLDLAREAIEYIRLASAVPTILHVCGDVGDIMEKLLEMPVDILSLEYQYLRELTWLNASRLSESGKKIALGCISVNRDDIPSVRWLKRELYFAIERYGLENIWGISPNCGMRMSDPSLARARMDRLVEVAVEITAQFH
jgi:5-methyltetrahydropteroyltriglutamate--homocysteine methyltransferase